MYITTNNKKKVGNNTADTEGTPAVEDKSDNRLVAGDKSDTVAGDKSDTVAGDKSDTAAGDTAAVRSSHIAAQV